MTTSIRRFLAVPVAASGLALAVACSNPGAALLPATDGWGPSGGVVSGGGHDAGSTSTPPPSPTGGGSGSGGGAGSGSGGGTGTGQMDASPGSPDSGGTVPVLDSGTGTKDASPPPAKGPLGSCTNPMCGTDTTQCGCTATDSQGNTVQLGCQAGGDCACFVNQQQVDNAFPENGACADTPSTQQQFLTSCTCQ
ncbi:MAG TPA: hypothetical protein VIF15_10005 [Polyangiaceae bacterium]|jgi:hypothetical protein